MFFNTNVIEISQKTVLLHKLKIHTKLVGDNNAKAAHAST